MDLSLLFDIGWQRIAMDGKCPENHPIMSALKSRGYVVSRKKIISSAPVVEELSAQIGDFWYHSDGCFLPLPPRLVCICVIDAEEGGELSLLDRSDIFAAWPDGKARAQQSALFGSQGHGVVAPIWESKPSPGVFRFRHDYMAVPPGESNSTIVVEAAQAVNTASPCEHSIGALRPGQAVFIDNWRFLHRRKLFTGIRKICRLWFVQENDGG